jgi:hypothetical protein
VRASGRGGRLKYRYQVAATIQAWTLEPVVGTNGHRFRLLADLSAIIEPWCSYRPLDLCLQMNGSQWTWMTLKPERFSLPTLEIELHDPPIIIEERRHAE